LPALHALLGFRRPVPVTIAEMLRATRVLFVPGTRTTPRLQEFGRKLRAAFQELGIREMTLLESLTLAGQLREGIVPIFLGESQTDLITLDKQPLQNLHSTQIVGIFDRKSPVTETCDLQTRLDSSVAIMADKLVTLCLFVTDDAWVMCTMNGAVSRYANAPSLTEDVRQALVPKIAARILPPRMADLTCRHETFDPLQFEGGRVATDFATAARLWSASHLLAAHTSLDRLQFRTPFHRQLIATFLDDRSGMSYGFLAWQLPTPCEAPLTGDDARRVSEQTPPDAAGLHTDGERTWLPVRLLGEHYLVPVPDVSVLCTRSGCRKDQLDPQHDLVRLTLTRGRILLETPHHVTAAADCRPSYDTFTILASALGNALCGALLRHRHPEAPFFRTLASRGLSLSHWHGYLDPAQIPPGYVEHGRENPGVCCSTPQSALYALCGKLQALEHPLAAGRPYLGDVQIEPHHGTNLCGTLSLQESAACVAMPARSSAQGHPGSEGA
jgi:hypothetical protein